MEVFGAISRQGTYYNYRNKKTVVRGWFISDIGYDQVKVNGKNAIIGLQRLDVYNNFKKYAQKNAGFAIEWFDNYASFEKASTVKIEVLNKGVPIYERVYEIPVIYLKESFLEYIKNQKVFVCGLDFWIEKILYFKDELLKQIEGFYDESQREFYNVPRYEINDMLSWGG